MLQAIVRTKQAQKVARITFERRALEKAESRAKEKAAGAVQVRTGNSVFWPL